jgi:LPPG:FO 2-phospho-L-lactate transferase
MGHYTVLAGGTGAARFLRGLVQIVPEEELQIIVNVGDDTEVWGLHVSPDIDSVVYGLSGKLDPVRGWGRRDDTFHCLETIEAYGMPSWFRVGDRDLATHLTRTELLRSGVRLSAAVERMARTLGVRARVLPATDDRVQTRVDTPDGVLGFQEFFVRERWQPEVRSVAFAGAAEARAPEAVIAAIRDAQLVIVAPSNPITSIGPILAVADIRHALRATRADVIAVSPVIGNAAVSGPAGRLMKACGFEVSPAGVANCYQDFLTTLIVHTTDAGLAPVIRTDTLGVQVTDILMSDDESARRLADFVVSANRGCESR